MRTTPFLSSALVGLLLTGGTVAAESSDQRNFTAHLSGDMERPQVVNTDAQGEAIFHLNKEGDELSYKLISDGLNGITAADIHMIQNADGTGPAVADLYRAKSDEDLPGAVLTEGIVKPEDLKGPLGGKKMADLVDAMRDGKTYVDIDTAQNPKGAIRGDLEVRGPEGNQAAELTSTGDAPNTANLGTTRNVSSVDDLDQARQHGNGGDDRADHGRP